MANSFYGFAGAQYAASALPPTAYIQPAIPSAVQVPAVAPTAYIQPVPAAYATATSIPRFQTYDPYGSMTPATPQYISTIRPSVVPLATPAIGSAPSPYESYYAPYAASLNPTIQPVMYTVPPASDMTAYHVGKSQIQYEPSKRYIQTAVPTSLYTFTTDPTKAFTSKPMFITTTYMAPTQARQNVMIKTYNIQQLASNSSSSNSVQSQESVITTLQSAMNSSSVLQPTVFTIASNQQKPAGQTLSVGSGFSCSTDLREKSSPSYHPRSLQPHYCDVCKVSCAGMQTYREHLDGQKHKKKEAASKAAPTSSSPNTRSSFYCELCDVSCSGNDIYAAHVHGAKHQKVLKLYTKMGKPIPKIDPSVKLSCLSTVSSLSSNSTNSSSKQHFSTSNMTSGARSSQSETFCTSEDTESSAVDVQPIGLEYIEEVRKITGELNWYLCKLCDCKFTDPFAKVMHTKGRRHRLMYKKKVDPSLRVDVKLNHGDQEKMRRLEAIRMRRYLEDKWRMECEQRNYEEDPWSFRPPGNPIPLGMKRPDSSTDHQVLAKHNNIYPTEKELEVIQDMVMACEKSLKLVSDFLTERTANEDASSPAESFIKGVMRINCVAKGLLLHGDTTVHLVALCVDKPTRSLLVRVVDALPKHLATVSSIKYDVQLCVEEVGCVVISEEVPKVNCVIMFTSPVIREQLLAQENVTVKADPPDVLNRQKCLEALALLRHAKWFQAKASGLQSCVIVIRVLKDFCRRVSSWQPITSWMLELLVEKCIASAGYALSPGEALRRVFECVASGILLPGGPGLNDPCEKEPIDAAVYLTKQQREEITMTAQQSLRMIAFRQVHKVLALERAPPSAARKRSGTEASNEEVEEKKEKLDEN